MIVRARETDEQSRRGAKLKKSQMRQWADREGERGEREQVSMYQAGFLAAYIAEGRDLTTLAADARGKL